MLAEDFEHHACLMSYIKYCERVPGRPIKPELFFWTKGHKVSAQALLAQATPNVCVTFCIYVDATSTTEVSPNRTSPHLCNSVVPTVTVTTTSHVSLQNAAGLLGAAAASAVLL